jgi:hypothetical protein
MRSAEEPRVGEHFASRPAGAAGHTLERSGKLESERRNLPWKSHRAAKKQPAVTTSRE